MPNRKTAINLMLAFASLAFSAPVASAQDCTPKHTFSTVEQGTLTIAVTTFVPYSYLDDSGAVKGIDGDIATEFAKRACLKVKPVAVDPAAAIQYVLSGQADITVGDWYRTAERAKVMNLSAPLYTDQMGLYSKQDGVKTIADLEGKRVGTVQGYLYVADLKALLGSSLKLYPNSVNMFQDLEADRVDVVVEGVSTGISAQAKGALKGVKIAAPPADERVKATMDAAQGAFPYAKAATEFGKALDEIIAEMHKDGTVVKIVTSYGLEASAADTGEPRLLD